MRKLIWSVGPNLPLSLLYNTGKRIQADKDHSNRWVPGEPSSSILERRPFMKLRESSLLLSSKGFTKFQGLLFSIPYQQPQALKGVVTLQDSGNGAKYLMDFIRDPKDSIDLSSCSRYYILIENTSYSDSIEKDSRARGACFLSNDQTDGVATGQITLHAKYDCSINVQVLEESSISSNSRVTILENWSVDNTQVLVGSQLDSERNLEIEAGTFVAHKYTQRFKCQFPSCAQRSSTYILALTLPFYRFPRPRKASTSSANATIRIPLRCLLGPSRSMCCIRRYLSLFT